MSNLQPSSWLIPRASSPSAPAAQTSSSLALKPASPLVPAGPSPRVSAGAGFPPPSAASAAGRPPTPYDLARAAGFQDVPAGPSFSVTHPEFFEGINMERLRSEFPDLYAKIQKYQDGQGQLGETYQYLIGKLGRAVTADDLFSENDIRNAGLAARNPLQAQAYQDRQAAEEAAAIGGALDSGDTHKYLATSDAAANLAAEQAAEGRVQDLTSYNQQFKYTSLQDAISALNEWVQNRRAQRMGDAGASAFLAQAEGAADAQRTAGAWGAAAGLLGAGSSLASSYLQPRR